MHPEILSLCLFMFVTSCSPGPNNVIASHSGFNHGIKKSVHVTDPTNNNSVINKSDAKIQIRKLNDLVRADQLI